ncbi:MAG: hypothetical protein AAF267_02180 [Deinococcota bacterium]
MKRFYLVSFLVSFLVAIVFASSAYAQEGLPTSVQVVLDDHDNLSLSAIEETDNGIYFEVLSEMPVRLSTWEVKQVYMISEDGRDCRLISNLRRSPLGAWQGANAQDHCVQFTVAEISEDSD